MNDRKSVLLALAVAVMLEITFLVRSGLLGWAVSGPHTREEVHAMMTDWRVIASAKPSRWPRSGRSSTTGSLGAP